MEFGVIELTQGNIDNNHLYLSGLMDFFPASSIGDPNDNELGTQAPEIHCVIAEPVHADIAGDKKIFRRRAWVREFFLSQDFSEGSKVVIESTGFNPYHIYLVRT